MVQTVFPAGLGFSTEQACFLCVVSVEQLEVSPVEGESAEQTATVPLSAGWSTEQPVTRWIVEHDPIPP